MGPLGGRLIYEEKTSENNLYDQKSHSTKRGFTSTISYRALLLSSTASVLCKLKPIVEIKPV